MSKRAEIMHPESQLLEELWSQSNVTPCHTTDRGDIYLVEVNADLAQRICDALGREYPGLEETAPITCDAEAARAEMIEAGKRVVLVIVGPHGRHEITADTESTPFAAMRRQPSARSARTADWINEAGT